MLPFEFTVTGPPVSHQSHNKAKLAAWRKRVRAAAAAQRGKVAPLTTPLRITVTYYAERPRECRCRCPEPSRDDREPGGAATGRGCQCRAGVAVRPGDDPDADVAPRHPRRVGRAGRARTGGPAPERRETAERWPARGRATGRLGRDRGRPPGGRTPGAVP